MQVTASSRNLTEIDDDVLIVPVFEGEQPAEGALAALDHFTTGEVARVFESGEMNGSRDRWVLLHDTGALRAKRLLLYGAGSADSADSFSLQRLAGTVARTFGSRGFRSAAFLLRDSFDPEMGARAVVEGWLIGRETGELYKSDTNQETRIERLDVIAEASGSPKLERAINVGLIMAEATNFARTLGNEPSNIMTPTELARRAEEMAAREGLGFEALEEEEMKQLGMGALLAVSRGSAEPARLIALTYTPEGAGGAGDEVIALVGKGITFDSGGISIKPAAHMEEMKFDMGGGAAVIGAMQAIARLKPPVRVLGVVPASENMPSGRAVKPGDVVRSLSGKTIEVVNTDAEGRLALADAIAYAINHGATHIVDAATLTGACVIALGEIRAAVMGTDQKLIDELLVSGEECGDRLWQMPLNPEYNDLIRSDIADVRNTGNRTAGAITAGMFIKTFTGGLPWAHMDIAGTAWLTGAKPYLAKGATGFGVRLMTNFVLNRNK